jgi:hypothetical protein
MVDPTAARAVSSVTYDSLGTMDQSADATGSLRTAMLRDLGLDQDDVGEFELALAHLRVAGSRQNCKTTFGDANPTGP